MDICIKSHVSSFNSCCDILVLTKLVYQQLDQQADIIIPKATLLEWLQIAMSKQ